MDNKYVKLTADQFRELMQLLLTLSVWAVLPAHSEAELCALTEATPLEKRKR